MSEIHTKPATKEYRSNWDKVFKKKPRCEHKNQKWSNDEGPPRGKCLDCGALFIP